MVAKPRGNDVRLASQGGERGRPWLRATLNVGLAGALLYLLRRILKRLISAQTGNESIGGRINENRVLPSPSTTDPSVRGAILPASDLGDDRPANATVDRNSPHSASRAASLPGHRRRILVPGWDVLLFAALFVGATLLAIAVMPSVSSAERLPLESPAIGSDAEDEHGALLLSKLELYESHGGINLSPAEKKFLGNSSDIFIEVGGRFTRDAVSPGKANISIDLPKYAGVAARCADRSESEFPPTDCQIEGRHLVISGAVTPQSDEFVVVARISGTPGIWLSATSSHADGRFPLVYDHHAYKGSVEQSALPVSIQFDVPDAPKWSWLGVLPNVVGPAYVSWDYDYTVGYQPSIASDRNPVLTNGVRDDVVENDSNKVFIAGVLLGVAGGALITALQAAVALVQRRQDRQRAADTP